MRHQQTMMIFNRSIVPHPNSSLEVALTSNYSEEMILVPPPNMRRGSIRDIRTLMFRGLKVTSRLMWNVPKFQKAISCLRIPERLELVKLNRL
jgi:hypothetical protein